MISVVLPTFNEAENLERLIPQIADVLRDLPHEIIIVDDDSPDRTWQAAERLSQTHKQVRVLRRVGRRGLSAAVVEGFQMAQGDVLAVMDSDGQHDPRLLTELNRAIQAGAHLAVASRYIRGGSTGKWGGLRLLISKMGTFLARHAPRVTVTDPMSGYFALRRTMFRTIAADVHPQGFKILLEIVAHLPRGSRVAEVPLTFRERWSGRSKFSLRVQFQFAWQLLRIIAGRMREFLWEAQWVVLFLVFLGTAAVLARPAWQLRILALDSRVRAQAQQALRTITDEQGWILSDIVMVSASERAMRFYHREHRRGRDPKTCHILRYDPPTLIPCS